MAQASPYDTLRRRVAPIALFLALGLLAFRTCDAQPTDVTVRVTLGEAAPSVRALELEVYPQGSFERVAVATFHWNEAGAPAAVSRPMQLDAGSYRVELAVTRTAGTDRLERLIEVTGEGRIDLDLTGALAPPSP